MEVSETRERFLDRIGIPSSLFLGFVGLLIFMIGDGVESGYLAPYLVSRGIDIKDVATISAVYGTTAALAGWFSGALSDVWGPRRVIAAGLAIWIVFQVAFLKIGLMHATTTAVVMTYGLRGLGYPLFAFGFLVWITVVAPKQRLASAMGWFWFAFTGGLPTLGSLVARYSIPRFGSYSTFWISTALVLSGGVILLAGVREKRGTRRLVEDEKNPFMALRHSIALSWRKPKIGIGCLVRIINTAPEFGFFIILPGFFEQAIGFSQAQFLTLLSAVFFSNILWNLLFGLIGDRLGWRLTVATCGGFGSAISTLLLFYVPSATHSYPASLAAGMLYGATLAGYVPLSALMPMLAPSHRGEALSMLNLGAGAAMLVGPALVSIFFHVAGVRGMIWTFAALYLVSGFLALLLTHEGEKVVLA